MSHSGILEMKSCYPEGMFEKLLGSSLGELFYVTKINSEIKSIKEDDSLTDSEKREELRKKKQEIDQQASQYLKMVQAEGAKVKYTKDKDGILRDKNGNPFEKNGQIDVYNYQGKREPRSEEFWKENKHKVHSVTVVHGARGKGGTTSNKTFLCNDMMIAEVPDQENKGFFKPVVSFDAYGSNWTDLPNAHEDPSIVGQQTRDLQAKNERAIKMITKVVDAKFKELVVQQRVDQHKKEGGNVQVIRNERDQNVLDIKIRVERKVGGANTQTGVIDDIHNKRQENQQDARETELM